MSPTKSQVEAANVAALLRARNVLLWVVTREEARVEGYLFEAAASAAYSRTHIWDVAAGVTGIDGKPPVDPDNPRRPDTAFAGMEENPDAVLDLIRDRSQQELPEDKSDRAVWIMRNFSPWITPPMGVVNQRRLCNLARSLPGRPRNVAQAIIVISPTGDVPPELANHATVIEWPLPDREEIAALLDATVAGLPENLQQTVVNGQREAAIDAAVGLSGEEAQACFARSLVQLKSIDPATIAQEKRRAIRGSGLEWVEQRLPGLQAVGGLDTLKQWFRSRASAYSPAARAYGLPSPKGALLVGEPGCGKTLIGEAIAAEWSVPFIKIDLNAMKGKFVGQSEANIRGAFGTLDAIGRCVVIADEIEKSLAGASGEAGDGGVAADALGALLSWMQDRQGEAYIIATANNIDKLPPELLRKGRFDEVWWVGLPDQAERAAVMAAALRSHGRNADTIGIDLVAIAAATDQFSGAEIAALVPDAMFAAFAENGREITTDDLLAAAKVVKPQALRADRRKRPEFAREAAASISTGAPVAVASGARQLDL